MMTWVDTFLDRLEQTTSLAEIQDLVVGLRDDLGVEHAIYHIAGDTGREYGALTYDPEWVKHYITSKYMRVDPVVNAAFQSTGPVDWRTLNWKPRAARQLIGEAVDEGVGKQGYTVPIRGANGQFAMFSVTSFDRESAWDAFGRDNLRQMTLVGHYIHMRANELMAPLQPQQKVDLSPRERDVLSLLATGAGRPEAADRLGISEHTLRAYIDTARLKLGAMNTTHAVAAALMRGLIMP